MSNISFNRLRCTSLVATVTGGRIFNYDGSTASLDGNTDVLAIADTKLTATWETAVNSTFRKGDLILISCTDGSISVQVKDVNSTTKVPTMTWLSQNPTT